MHVLTVAMSYAVATNRLLVMRSKVLLYLYIMLLLYACLYTSWHTCLPFDVFALASHLMASHLLAF